MNDQTQEQPEQRPDHASRGHHPQGPSQLKVLNTCPGFENRPGTSAAAEMGTRIHEALEIRDPSHLESELEIELYEKCVEAEDKLIAEFFGDMEYERYNELPLTISLNSGLEIWGTGDVFCISKCGTKGLMIDYKSGRMKVDDAEDNWQARAYKNGGYEAYPDMEILRFIFLAPQLDLIDYHDFLPESVDIDRQLITQIVKKAQWVRDMWANGDVDPGVLNPNDHCTFCRHAQYCPTINGVLLDTATAAGIEVPDHINVDNLTDPDEVAALYGVAKLLEPVIEKIKQAAVELAKEGEVLPGWGLRSMGSKRIAADNRMFWDYCAAHGLGIEDLLDNVNLPVAKFRDLLRDRAPRGSKGQVARDFETEGVDMGVIVMGKERLTLTSDASDE